MGKSIFWSLTSLLLLLGSCHFLTVETVSCGSCQEDQCSPPPEDCPGGLTLDPCGCCAVCARVQNQTCGGQYDTLGTCDQGLTCVISPDNGQPITGHEEGLCLVTNHENSEKPLCDKCEVPEDPLCPNDTQVIYRETECCPKPSCHCKPCPKDPCPSGFLSQVLESGDGSPGSCCDIVECLPREEVCANVTCSNHSRGMDDEDFADDSSGDPDSGPECPLDSLPLPPELTHNGCCLRHVGCKCREDFECPVPECPPFQQLQLKEAGLGTPAKCCDVFHCVDRDCHYIHDNSTRQHGEAWHIDNCTKCECDRGLTVCSVVPCPTPPPDCIITAIPEGSCCPECLQSRETVCRTRYGEEKNEGETWMPDECTTCQCHSGGGVSCQMAVCSVPCTYPRIVPGHCCPQCDDVTSFTLPPHCPLLHNCTLLCHSGLHRGDDGCYICQCKDFNCDLECPMGFKYDQLGHKLCECRPVPTIAPTCSSMESCPKTCTYGFKKDKHGCPRCRCNKCPAFHCKKKCLNGYVYNSMGCKLCRCMDSNATETTTAAVVLQTVGPGCMSAGGQLMEDGQSWYDGCRRCFCMNGHEMCALITCPVPQCRNLIFKPGDCCPSCAGDIKDLSSGLTTQCESNGKIYHVEGDTWRMDKCTQCICHENGVLCEAEACPPVLCHHPIKLPNTCCPLCPDESIFPVPPVKVRKVCRTESGTHFKDGDSWRVSPCQSCICQLGQIHCFSQTCPQLNCNKTVFKKGQCCPNCLGSQRETVPRGNGTKPEVPADTAEGQATVIILGIMVVLLMLTVFLLLLLLLRTRRKIFRVRDPIHSRRLEDGALFLNKEKNLHLKSTNVDLQGNSPLPGEALKLLHWTDDPYGQVWKQDNLENEALQENKFRLAGEDHLPLGYGGQEKEESEQKENEAEENQQEENNDDDDEDKKPPISSDEDTASCASSNQETTEKGLDEKSDNLIDNESSMPASLEDRLQYNDLNFLLSNGGCPPDSEVTLSDDQRLMGKDPLLNLFLYIPSDVDPNNFRKSV